MNTLYRRQAALLVKTIPYIAREPSFALKGGTAINLFYRDLPRLSVDIDLVYLGFEPRDEAILLIEAALERVAQALKAAGLGAVVQGSLGSRKLLVSDTATVIKVEPNYTLRGHSFPTQIMSVSPLVEETFGYAEMQIISPAELFGGKLCAALDRQHPRDLFDVALLLAEPDTVPDLMAGFTIMLLCHNRPANELLEPIDKDMSTVFTKEFQGMTDQAFSYDDHRQTLHRLLGFVSEGLTPFKSAIIDFFSLMPTSITTLPSDFNRLPAIQWKRQNLIKLRTDNPGKFEAQVERIKHCFKS